MYFPFMAILTIGELIRSPVVHSFVSKYALENARGQYMEASNLQFTIGRFIAPIMIVFSTWLSQSLCSELYYFVPLLVQFSM